MWTDSREDFFDKFLTFFPSSVNPTRMLSMGSRGSELRVNKPKCDQFHQQELRSWPPANSIKHFHIGIFIVLLGTT